MDVRAGDVHFQHMHAGRREPLRHLHIFIDARTGDIRNHRDVLFKQPRQIIFDKAVHAGVLKSDAVEHAARRFRDAGRRVARARLEAQALDGDAAQLTDIIQLVIFASESERAACGDNRVFQLYAAKFEGQISHSGTPPSRQTPGRLCRRAYSTSRRPPS